MLFKLSTIFLADRGSPNLLAEDELQLAAALLLIEVARADYEEHGIEFEVLTQHIKERFTLTDSDAQQIIDYALRVADDMVSLHEHVAQINSHYSRAQKLELLRSLWEVAYADDDLHHYEEHLIRRLSELLYIPHRDFIRTKHFVSSS